MATVKHPLGTFGDDGAGTPLVFNYLYYDDATLLATAFQCVNNSDQPAFGSVTSQQNGKVYSGTFAAHTDTTVPISGQQNSRIGITIIPTGPGTARVTGYDGTFTWPAA